MTQIKNKPQNTRSEYKRVWNDLSDSLERAVYHVTGKATEEQLRECGLEDAKKIIRKTKITNKDTVLEIGCGVGRLGYPISQLCKKWIGCDVSTNMLGFAKERLKQKPNTQFEELFGNDLRSIESNSIDVVYCSVVFMHLEEWDRYNYIKEGYRVLKKSGRIYIDNFNLDSDMGWEIFLAHHAFPLDKREPHISNSSNKIEFKVFLKKAGFTKIKFYEEDQTIIGTGMKK